MENNEDAGENSWTMFIADSIAEKGKTKTEFIATDTAYPQSKKELTENVKERATLKGNLGQDPVSIEVNGEKKVAAFSIAIRKDGNDSSYWQQIQVWNEGIEKNKIAMLKKGDLVELKGYYGKEYQNSKQETQRDFVLEESRVLRQAQEKELAPKQSSGIRM